MPLQLPPYSLPCCMDISSYTGQGMGQSSASSVLPSTFPPALSKPHTYGALVAGVAAAALKFCWFAFSRHNRALRLRSTFHRLTHLPDTLLITTAWNNCRHCCRHGHRAPSVWFWPVIFNCGWRTQRDGWHFMVLAHTRGGARLLATLRLPVLPHDADQRPCYRTTLPSTHRAVEP